jgi:hypothetical protein
MRTNTFHASANAIGASPSIQKHVDAFSVATVNHGHDDGQAPSFKNYSVVKVVDVRDSNGQKEHCGGHAAGIRRRREHLFQLRFCHSYLGTVCPLPRIRDRLRRSSTDVHLCKHARPRHDSDRVRRDAHAQPVDL